MSLIERFTKPNITMKLCKSIVRNDISNLIIINTLILGVNTNYFCNSNGKRLFLTNFYFIQPPKKPKAYIKHFFTKTAEEFCMKLRRGDAHYNKEQTDYKFIMKERINKFMKINKITNGKLYILEKCSGINLNKYRYKITKNSK